MLVAGELTELHTGFERSLLGALAPSPEAARPKAARGAQ